MNQQNQAIYKCSCEIELVQQQNNVCDECAFSQSIQLSQQIMHLRTTLKFYQQKQKQLEQLNISESLQQNLLLKPLQNLLNKQIISESESNKQIIYLNSELLRIQNQIKDQVNYQNKQDKQNKSLIEEILVLQSEELKNQMRFKELSQFYDRQIRHKQIKLNKMIDFLQITNFVSIIYSISFDNNQTLLNGEKIIVDNCWKIVEILAFYHEKYDHYQPLAEIRLDDMSIGPCEKLVSDVKYGIDNKFPSLLEANILKLCFTCIQIQCEQQEIILQKWMPYVILEMKNIFQFISKESGVAQTHKLKYQIDKRGNFEALKQKSGINSLQKFSQTIKYLMSDIQQINRLQFFANQMRFKLGQKNRKSQEII